MISNDSNIQQLTSLVRELYDNMLLRFRLYRLDFLSKLAVLLSAVLVSVVVAIVGAVALFYFAYAGALAMAPGVGGLAVACLIIGGIFVIIGIIVYGLRRRLILRPLTAFLARLLLADDATVANEPTNEREEQP